MTTELDRLAAFVTRVQYDDLSADARQQLKNRVLDTLGCAIGALDAAPITAIRTQLNDFGGNPLCSLIGSGRTAPDRAAFYNGALVRYLDFMDSYLAKGETCHPSDNLAAVLAAAEYAGADGEAFLTTLAVAYQVQARLSDEAPVRDRGFDHTTQGAYAVGAGIAKALGLDSAHTANAIALSGVGNIALRVTRTGALSQWKGLAYPNTAFIGTHAAFLAMRGITGPPEVFEGNKGFMESVSGAYQIDWAHEDLERVTRTIVKKYNAEIHAQSAIEGAIELRQRHGFSGDAVARVEVDIFDVAYKIIGGGEEGDKTVVRTKEQADHSLQYMLAAALYDGELLPAQYTRRRILASDVQSLLHRVTVKPDSGFSARFPEEMACRIRIILHDGQRYEIEKQDYEGFHTQPMAWEAVVAKFHQLVARHIAEEAEQTIVETVAQLDQMNVQDLTRLLTGTAGATGHGNHANPKRNLLRAHSARRRNQQENST